MSIFKSRKIKECSLDDCLNSLKNNLKRLASTYEEQNKNIEDFARWNLPDDIASDWENYEYFVDRLLAEKAISNQTAELFHKIVNNFISAYPKITLAEWNKTCVEFGLDKVDEVPNEAIRGQSYDEAIWTHEGLKTHLFWKEQRELAKQILSNL